MNCLPHDPSSEIGDLLRFEMLLTELSARLVGVTAETIDTEIVSAQRQIVQALDLDRSILAQRQDDDRYVVTHTWAQPGFDPFPGFAAKDLPWITCAVNRGEEVRYTSLEDMPEEALRDKEILRRFGPQRQSFCIFALKVGGKTIGGIGLAPFHTVARLTLLSKSQCRRDAGEAVYFDVTGHATSDSTPVGSMNRARWPAEVASRKARRNANVYLSGANDN